MRRIVALMAFALVCASVSAQSLTVKNGPWVTGVSETGFTVLWTTPETALCQLEVAPDDGMDFDAIPRKVFVGTVAGRNVFSTFHSVKVTGLEPGTRYRYRIAGQLVKDASNPYDIKYKAGPCVASCGSVSTLDRKADRCRLIQLNDIHYDTGLYSSLLSGKTGEDADFLLLNGDIVSYVNEIDKAIEATFDPASELLKSIPVVYARGNHESRGADFAEMPKLFPSPTGEFYFQFRQGPVAFIVLDAGEDKPDNTRAYAGYAYFDEYRERELEWLKNAVKDPDFLSAPIKIAIMHIPPLRKKDSWYTQLQMNGKFLPVLNDAGIDLMLSAHHHKYIFADKGEYGNDFPIIVNSNVERLELCAEAGPGQCHISVDTYDTSGKHMHSYATKLKEKVISCVSEKCRPGEEE